MHSVICPSCRHPIDADGVQAGQLVTCPNCGKRSGIPVDTPDEIPLAVPSPPLPETEAPPVAGSTPSQAAMGWSCPNCNHYNHRPSDRCEQCGAFRSLSPTGATHTDGLAVASLVVGLAVCVPFVPQALAVTFGILSLRRIRQAKDRLTGAALAWAGLVLGTTFGLLWSMVGLGVFQSGAWRTGVVGPIPAGMAVTGAQDDDDEMGFAEVSERLERLGKALKSHANDFRRLPPSLGALVPSYATSDWLCYDDGAAVGIPFKYVAGVDPYRSPANTIIVYTAPLVAPPEPRGYPRFGQPDEPKLWKKGRAPKGTQRMILQLNWRSELIGLEAFDRRMADQRTSAGGSASGDSDRTGKSPADRNGG